MPRRKVSVSSTRKVVVYVYMYEGARFALEQAEASEEGRFYNCMSSIIHSAFCLEAYLNHVGPKNIPYWDSIERKLSPQEKLVVLDHELDLRVDHSRPPFQNFKSIFDFRNTIAHGRTEILKGNEIQSIAENERVQLPQTSWEKQCTLTTARKYLADLEKMITHIHEKGGHGKHPFVMSSFGTAWVGTARDKRGDTQSTG